MTMVDPGLARRLWHVIETINAVTYFAPECRAAPSALGLKGFWMGYVAGRAAPLGAVGPGVVEATFFNFHPERIRRALPEAWAIASPDRVLDARAGAAAAALRRLLPAGEAERLASDASPALAAAVDDASWAGRPLFAANRDVRPPDDPVAALWQAATTLREHRGDGHVALLTAAGLDGCEVHVLVAAGEDVAPELYQASRGWSTDDWDAARQRLAARRLVTVGGSITDDGRALRADIEARTDTLAATAYEALGDDAGRLLAVLAPAAARVAAAGEITYPNPMGLPAVDHQLAPGS